MALGIPRHCERSEAIPYMRKESNFTCSMRGIATGTACPRNDIINIVLFREEQRLC